MRNDVSIGVLRLFLRIASTRSFSETARLEHVSQPALSRTIRLLEEQLNVRLFDRDTRNVALTAAGAQLAPIAERLICEHDLAFGDLAQTFAGQKGRVSVGALPSIAAGLLPPVLARFREERPSVEVRVHDGLSGSLLQLLVDRRIDFAITMAPEASDRVAFEPLLTDEFVLICRPGDRLARNRPLAWSALADEPFVAMAPESSVRRVTDEAFRAAGVQVAPLFECGQLATVAGLVREGLGVSVLPSAALALISGANLFSRPLSPAVRRSIGIARLYGRSLSPAGEALVQSLRAANLSDAPSI